MYDIEVHIRNKASTRDLLYHKEKLGVHEGETSYKEKVIHLNLTGTWDLALGDYDAFLDELVGMILHEYLHYFFHVNGLPQNEEMIYRLSIDLQILSLGRLIGATENTEENVRQYKKCIEIRFGGKIDS